MTIWKDIHGYEGLYQVSDTGYVKSLDRYQSNHSTPQFRKGEIKSLRKDTQGYLLLDLYKNGKGKTVRIHRLVAETFISNPLNKETVNHKDGDKTNNCIENLEWSTSREQNKHYYSLGLKKQSNISKAVVAMTKKTSKEALCITTGRLYNSASEAARDVGVSPSLVMRACRGESNSW
nr:MAG TPA: homing endonuclease [Caudoviricetes sp.]